MRKLVEKILKSKISIYTDGSLKDGVGAWAFVVVKKDQIVDTSYRRVDGADCNQMELQAAIEALTTLAPKTKGVLYSDSRILIDTVTKWMPEWKGYQWVKKNGRPIPYIEQIKILDQLNSKHQIEWKWIKSHSGNPFNELCDELCAKARDN